MNTLLSEQTSSILLLTLNRPETVNAFTGEMLGALAKAFREAAANETVRAIVVRGAGRGFCSGQDLKVFSEQNMSFKEGLKSYAAVVENMAACEKPIIAAIHGAAAGAGLSFALAADYRIATDNAVLTTGFSKIGLIPDCAMPYTLPRLVGQAKAFELMTLSPRLTAQDSLALGLVNKVVPADDFEAEVGKIAAEFAAGPTKTFGLIKRVLSRSQHATLEEMLEYEALIQEVAGRTEDHKEGVQAFYEKRPARFQGK
jgi:2-(1,2-epoxy-1,2-dihydrophenyl)acetyl-CoA isomerase